MGYPESWALTKSAGTSAKQSRVGPLAPHRSAAPAMPHNSAKSESWPTRWIALAGEIPITDSSSAAVAGRAGGYVQFPSEIAGKDKSPLVAKRCESVENPIQSTPFGYSNSRSGRSERRAAVANASGNHQEREDARSIARFFLSSISSSNSVVSPFNDSVSMAFGSSPSDSIRSARSSINSHCVSRRTRITSLFQ